jgi:hypothetical protein
MLLIVAGVEGILVLLKFVGDAISVFTVRKGNRTAYMLPSELGVSVSGVLLFAGGGGDTFVILLLFFLDFRRRNMILVFVYLVLSCE